MTLEFKQINPFLTYGVGVFAKIESDLNYDFMPCEIVSWFPDATFFMENPEGMLQKHPVLSYFKVYSLSHTKATVTYCTYGETIMKPTHIWHNCKAWNPRKPCSIGDTCHEKSPRSSQKAIRSKANAFERSKIPPELCNEVLMAASDKRHTKQILNFQEQLFPNPQPR